MLTKEEWLERKNVQLAKQYEAALDAFERAQKVEGIAAIPFYAATSAHRATARVISAATYEQHTSTSPQRRLSIGQMFISDASHP